MPEVPDVDIVDTALTLPAREFRQSLAPIIIGIARKPVTLAWAAPQLIDVTQSIGPGDPATDEQPHQSLRPMPNAWLGVSNRVQAIRELNHGHGAADADERDARQDEPHSDLHSVGQTEDRQHDAGQERPIAQARPRNANTMSGASKNGNRQLDRHQDREIEPDRSVVLLAEQVGAVAAHVVLDLANKRFAGIAENPQML